MKLKAFLSEAFIFLWCCLFTGIMAGLAHLAGEQSFSIALFAGIVAAILMIYVFIPLGEFIRGKIFE